MPSQQAVIQEGVMGALRGRVYAGNVRSIRESTDMTS